MLSGTLRSLAGRVSAPIPGAVMSHCRRQTVGGDGLLKQVAGNHEDEG